MGYISRNRDFSMGWQQEEVVKLNGEQIKQFYPGGWWEDTPHAKQRLYCYFFCQGGLSFGCSVCFFGLFAVIRLLMIPRESYYGEDEDGHGKTRRGSASPMD